MALGKFIRVPQIFFNNSKRPTIVNLLAEANVITVDLENPRCRLALDPRVINPGVIIQPIA